MVKRYLILTLLSIFLTACGSAAASLNNQANIEFEAESYMAAIDGYREAQLEDPELAVPYYNIGNAYYRLEEYETAALQEVVALRNSEDEAFLQDAFFNQGNANFLIGEFSAAIDAYKEVLRLNPDDMEAKYNLELALQYLEDRRDHLQNQEEPREDQEEQEQQPNENQDQQEEQNERGQQEEEQQQRPDEQSEQEPNQQDQQQQDQQDQQQTQNPQQNQSQQQESQQSQSQQEFTPEQARQLMEAISQDTETLQERLQRVVPVPGPLPSQDW